jgi:hypothetical protein
MLPCVESADRKRSAHWRRRGVTGFNAGPGYDQTTGWGSIDFNVFAAAVKAVPLQTGPLTFPKTVPFGTQKVGAPPAKAKVVILSNPAKNKNPAILSADAVLGNTTDFKMTASNLHQGCGYRRTQVLQCIGPVHSSDREQNRQGEPADLHRQFFQQPAGGDAHRQGHRGR